MSNPTSSFSQQIWDFFCSLKLALFILFSLAITSIIGTIIPQFPNIDERYWSTITPARRALYEKLGFFDMYHSWWFLALLTLFSINLIACSIKRLPHIIKFVTEPSKTLSEGQQKAFISQEIKLKSGLDEAKDKLIIFLTSRFTKPEVTQVDDKIHLFAEKSPWCRLGVYVVHLSILVIMLGAIVGNIFGYKGFVAIVEGETINSIHGRSGKTIPLGFEIRCDQFNVTFYETPSGARSQMPKEFKSILTLTENGKEIPDYKHVRVIVNEPLTFRGITFYQSSYGQANESSAYYFRVKVRSTGQESDLLLRPGMETELPDGRMAAILELTENPSEGPVAVLGVREPAKEPNFFKVFMNHPTLDELRGDSLIFSFTGTDARMYTGLQVNKDPGSWIVWLGCILMSLGLYVAFFVSHKRIWVILQPGSARIFGNASKNQPGFLLEFEAMAEELKKQDI